MEILYHIWRKQLHTIKLLEEKALHPQVPSYSKSTVPPQERERERQGREEGAQEKKDSFSILLFSSSDASDVASERVFFGARRRGTAAPASENDRKKDKQAGRGRQRHPQPGTSSSVGPKRSEGGEAGHASIRQRRRRETHTRRGESEKGKQNDQGKQG